MYQSNIELKIFSTIFFSEFPNCVRALDGTQIPIEAPWINPELHIYSHKRNSISVLAVVNHRGVMTYLSARWPGGVHDSRVLQESFLQDVLDRNLLGEHYIIADQGYHLQRNLLTPFSKI